MNKLKNLIKNSSPDREYLLRYLLGFDQSQMLLATEKIMAPSILKKLKLLEKKLANGMPLQYLVGQAWFYGLNFVVNKNVLIPRPETELIVDDVLAQSRQVKNKIKLFDLGTGSGCVAIALAKKLRAAEITAIDISERALKVARSNARRLRAKIKFQKSNLLTKTIWPRTSPIFMTANLPYLSGRRMKKLAPQVRREPRLALAGGLDGLNFYRQLFVQIKIRRRATQSIFVWAEIDPEQKKKFASLVAREFPNASINFYNDLHGDVRLAKVSIID